MPHLFIYFSESHRHFYYHWFAPTLEDSVDLHVFEVDQICPKGEFNTPGWKEMSRKKLEIALDMIDRFWGELVIYSDVDIQFFRPFTDEILSLMKNHDFLIQKGGPNKWCCGGFFVLRANYETKKLIDKALYYMDKGRATCDETALNLTLRRSRGLKWSHLPDSFFSGGLMTGKIWSPGDPLLVPENIILHHSNFCIGIENKWKQLEYVYSQINPSI